MGLFAKVEISVYRATAVHSCVVSDPGRTYLGLTIVDALLTKDAGRLSPSAMAVTTQIGSLDDEMRDCVDNCLEATEAGEWCADECIKEGNPEMSRCIELCRDVSDIASLHARLMIRESEFHPGLAAVCADACEACADECEQFDSDHCQLCADVMRECAQTCRDMAA